MLLPLGKGRLLHGQAVAIGLVRCALLPRDLVGRACLLDAKVGGRPSLPALVGLLADAERRVAAPNSALALVRVASLTRMLVRSGLLLATLRRLSPSPLLACVEAWLCCLCVASFSESVASASRRPVTLLPMPFLLGRLGPLGRSHHGDLMLLLRVAKRCQNLPLLLLESLELLALCEQ